jgi:hypothetical protein
MPKSYTIILVWMRPLKAFSGGLGDPNLEYPSRAFLFIEDLSE